MQRRFKLLFFPFFPLFSLFFRRDALKDGSNFKPSNWNKNRKLRSRLVGLHVGSSVIPTCRHLQGESNLMPKRSFLRPKARRGRASARVWARFGAARFAVSRRGGRGGEGRFPESLKVTSRVHRWGFARGQLSIARA